MKQPHTEHSVDHTEGQQNTGNHPKPGAGPGPDGIGGTRAGAENVEPTGKGEGVETATDIECTPTLDAAPNGTGSANHTLDHPRERTPERDENGRL